MRVGFVEDIQLLGDIDTAQTMVRVVMRIYPDRYQLSRQDSPALDFADYDQAVEQLIRLGLRAQLGIDSFVTGQLVVELDFHPGTEALQRGAGDEHLEIPSIPNNVQQMMDNAQRFVAELRENLDIGELSRDLQEAAEGIRDLAASEDLRQTIAGINKIVNAEQTQVLPETLELTLQDARSALASVRKLTDDADTGLAALVEDLNPVINRLELALVAAEKSLQSFNQQMRGDTELSYQLTDTLSEVERVASALRSFLDYVERHPEALLRGKSE